jgi:hypothetical protein
MERGAPCDHRAMVTTPTRQNCGGFQRSNFSSSIFGGRKRMVRATRNEKDVKTLENKLRIYTSYMHASHKTDIQTTRQIFKFCI